MDNRSFYHKGLCYYRGMKHLHIGLRVIKTVIAVFLCFLVDYLRGSGMPFYSTIAAVLCIQKDMEHSFKVAKNREIATLIGALAGSLYLFIEQNLISVDHELLRYLILSLLLIPVILFAVNIHQENSVFLSCVVFLSVTINHAFESPLSFALTRLIDTTIGIAVALGVNFLLPSKKDA